MKMFKSKFLIGVLVVAVLVGGFVVVSAKSASAETCSITMTLRSGSVGAEVSCLQAGLNSRMNAGLSTDGKFGPLTAAAVRNWQTSKGLVADAIFGPMSRAKWMEVSGNVPSPDLCPNGNTLASNCTAAPGQPTNTALCPNGMTVESNCTLSPITGNANGAGSVADYDLLSTPADNREVVQTAGPTKVLGMSIEADPGSDLTLTAVKVDFGQGTADRDFEKYASSVSIMLGTTQLALVNASDFTDDNGFERTLTLSGSGATIPADQTRNLYVLVTSISNLDSADDGQTWTVDVTSVRYTDGQGAVISEDPATDPRTFTFETPTSSGDLELKLTEATSNPDAQVIEADATGETPGVVLLKGTLKATGSAIKIKDLATTITPAGNSDGDEIASGFILKINGEEIQSVDSGACTVAANCDADLTDDFGTALTYVFDEVDYTVAENSTVSVEILADVNEIDGVEVVEGASLFATLDLDHASNVIRDAAGDDLEAGDLVGIITGEEQAFYSAGVKITLVSATATKESGGDPATVGDAATFTIKYKATAFNSNVYINAPLVEDDNQDAADEGTSYLFNDGAGITDGTVSVTSSSTGDTTANNTFEILEGQDETITVTIVVEKVPADTTEFIRASLESINWSLTDIAAPALYYDFNLDEYETGDIYVKNAS